MFLVLIIWTWPGWEKQLVSSGIWRSNLDIATKEDIVGHVMNLNGLAMNLSIDLSMTLGSIWTQEEDSWFGKRTRLILEWQLFQTTRLLQHSITEEQRPILMIKMDFQELHSQISMFRVQVSTPWNSMNGELLQQLSTQLLNHCKSKSLTKNFSGGQFITSFSWDRRMRSIGTCLDLISISWLMHQVLHFLPSLLRTKHLDE